MKSLNSARTGVFIDAAAAAPPYRRPRHRSPRKELTVKKTLVTTIAAIVLIAAAAGATLGVFTAYAGQQSYLHPCGKLTVHSVPGVPDPAGAERIQRSPRYDLSNPTPTRRFRTPRG